jgi:cytochrome c553
MADGNTLLIGDDMKPVPSGTMGRIARGYTDAEIAAVAEHFARQGR